MNFGPSALNTVAGSVRAARRAGNHAATMAVAISTSTFSRRKSKRNSNSLRRHRSGANRISAGRERGVIIRP
jgi:hypothetical protein